MFQQRHTLGADLARYADIVVAKEEAQGAKPANRRFLLRKRYQMRLNEEPEAAPRY